MRDTGIYLPDGAKITLDPNSNEKDFGWFSPSETAEKMALKFPDDFRELVRALK